VTPNIVTGSGITGALRYAMGEGVDPETGERLELVPGETSRAQVLGQQNIGFEIDSADRLDLARRMMEWNGLPENQAGKTRKLDLDCLHASLSWGDGQKPDRAEMIEAGHSFLKAIGLEKAQAVFIAHDDTDHAHIHVVASRIDPETGRSLRMDYDKIEAHKWAVQWEKDHGQERNANAGINLHGLIDAIGKRDAAAVVAHLTRDKATFSTWDVNNTLRYGNFSKDEQDKFRAEILGRQNVIGLRETAEAPVTRYTTREILAAEMALQRSAGALAADERHGVKASRVEKAVEKFTLIPEQAEALRHLTGAEGFAVLWGEAGTGKSHTLKAVRAVYEAEGKKIIGLSHQNTVVNAMRRDGFTQANTLAGEMFALENGRTKWNAKTVVVIDEAGMISTEALARVAAAAKQAGAKLILAGDDRQLGSIERGGMFETLRQSHGAAILKQVQRNKDVDQKAAFNQMHAGGKEAFLKALKTFEKAGTIHWTTRQSDTLKRMAERYTADVAATPDKIRFMFAIRNADCATLNAHARALHKARGDLGADHTIKTATGEQQFATGDRIQFTGTSRKQAQKRAGISAGNVGTVRGIDIGKDGRARLTVEFDAPRGEKPQRVSFVVGDDEKAGEVQKFRHGYAGTIYGGQGRTLDEAYVGHSSQWRSSAAYVALSRHRENVHIFAARETVKNLDEMAAGMARADNKRAATAFQIDEQSAACANLEKAVEEYQPPPASQSFAASIQQLTADLAVSGDAAGRAATIESAAPVIAQAPTFAEAATATVLTVEQKEEHRIADIEALRVELQQRNEIAASSAGQPVAPTPAATIESAAPGTAPIDAATIVEKSIDFSATAHSPQEATAPQVAPEGVIDALGGLAHGFTKLAEGAAHLAEGAVDLLAGFFGGGGIFRAGTEGRAARRSAAAETPLNRRGSCRAGHRGSQGGEAGDCAPSRLRRGHDRRRIAHGAGETARPRRRNFALGSTGKAQPRRGQATAPRRPCCEVSYAQGARLSAG
jgi:AAA domain/Relaxase/Mobilisation nuclease domain